jgi:lysyl-tRNA synthetase class 2
MDLKHCADGWNGLLGGRVVHSAVGTVVVSDACHSVSIDLDAGQPVLDAGCLVVVRARKHQGMLTSGVVVQSYPTSRTGAPPREHDRLFRLGVGRHLESRARTLALIRAWFAAERFLEVDTAQRVPSPGLDLHLDAFQSEDAYLITSPEYQMKRLLAGGLPRIYQLAHCFRRGEDGPWHNPEFLMLEWYRAFAGIDHVIEDTERLVVHVVSALSGTLQLQVGAQTIDMKPPFERITVCDAFERYAGVAPDVVLHWAECEEDLFFRVLVERVEPALAKIPRPVVLIDFPAKQASLARLKLDDPRLCERFELYVAGHELCNGFGELVDPVEQQSRFDSDLARRRAEGKPEYPIDSAFVESLVDGMPPSGGNALGVDRLIALCAGAESISDVLPFPTQWLRESRGAT